MKEPKMIDREQDPDGSVATCKYWIVIDKENAPPRAMFRQQAEANFFQKLHGGRIETFEMKVRY